MGRAARVALVALAALVSLATSQRRSDTRVEAWPPPGETAVAPETTVTLIVGADVELGRPRLVIERKRDGSAVIGETRVAGHEVTFTPQRPFEVDTDYVVRVEAGLDGAQVPIPYEFSTANRPGLRCARLIGSGVELSFSQAIDPASLTRETVWMNVAYPAPRWTGGRFHTAVVEAEAIYVEKVEPHLTLRPGIRAADGTPMDGLPMAISLTGSRCPMP